MERYDPKTIEARWQRVWEDERAFHVENPEPGDDRSRKSYVLAMLPYPSGTLHMGHVLVYTIGDVLARFQARRHERLLHPIGFDSFGLPAENDAIRKGGHPRAIVEENITHITREMKRMGWSFDWDRVIAAHEPEYYRWTQWLFLRLFEADLAYRKPAPVKWCPKDQVVLANEQVHDGRCEYCGTEVVSKNLEQWFFKSKNFEQAADACQCAQAAALVDAQQRCQCAQSGALRRKVEQARSVCGRRGDGTLNMRKRTVNEFAVGHHRRTDAFAGAALETIFQVRAKLFGMRQLAAGKTLDECDASARRFAFVARQMISRTMRQAHAAFDAAVGERIKLFGGMQCKLA